MARVGEVHRRRRGPRVGGRVVDVHQGRLHQPLVVAVLPPDGVDLPLGHDRAEVIPGAGSSAPEAPGSSIQTSAPSMSPMKFSATRTTASMPLALLNSRESA